MCGIAGILELDPRRRPSREGLHRMAEVLSHRGPDEEGFYECGPVAFAHRRLSIIDLAGGQQPMETPDGQGCVRFKREIYNYPELKTELGQRGHVFRTRSDTEVLLALYVHEGLEAFARLNGMFACAFWDRRASRLVLVRDRLGKKPLFYYRDAQRVLFASEIKALLAFGGVERPVNLRALHEYLAYGYIVGEQAILEGVHRVEPGETVVVHAGHVSRRPYWRLRFEPSPRPPGEAEATEQANQLLRQAVRRRMISDVPLGAFLSGGLDSSTVVALMAELSSRPVKTFSIGFEETDYSELEDARRVARHLGTDHHEMIVKPAALDVLPDLVWHLDEPFADSSALATYYVCQAARQHVTVALSGDGGDEGFAGYAQYQPADILTKVDRMSMANSLEVRAPLLDYTLVEYVATLPVSFKLRGTLSKYLLRKVGERLLPAATLTKAKQGFGIPKDHWFRQTLRPFAEEILLDRRSLARGYFRKDALTRMLRHNATGRRDYSTWIWSLIVLETWCRLFLDAPAAGVAGAWRGPRG